MDEKTIDKIVELSNSKEIIETCEANVINHETIYSSQVKRVIEALKKLGYICPPLTECPPKGGQGT